MLIAATILSAVLGDWLAAAAILAIVILTRCSDFVRLVIFLLALVPVSLVEIAKIIRDRNSSGRACAQL